MDNLAAPIPSISPQPAISSPAESPNRRWLLWLAGGLFMLIIGIAIGVFSVKFFSQSPSPSQLPPTPTPTLSPTPPSAPNPTATWKTYTNSVYKFSFRYPSAWTQSEREDENENMLVVDLAGEGFSSPSQYQANNLLVRVLPAAKQPTEQVCFPRKTSPECFSVSQAQSTTINNISGYLIDYFIPVPGGVSKTDKVRLILVESNGYIYSISQQRIISKEKEFLSAFDQILSTFKFTDETSSAPTSTINTKKLTYFLPSGWKTVQSSNRSFEVGYDPATTRADVNSYVQDGISLFKENFTNVAYFTVRLMPYSGGSRHQFLYNYLGEKPVKEDLMPNYHETEYLYDGKSCLFLVGISISQFPSTFGMCDAGGGKAFLITSFDDENYEEPLRTIKPL